MCGLVGMAGTLTAKDDDTLKGLLMHDYFRGPDATGVAAIGNYTVKIAKLANSPPVLFDSNTFRNAISGVNRCFIGHNRFATRGAKSDFNAHPFHYGHIIGAHNGTLDAPSTTRLEEALKEKFNVDSQALIAAIAKFGIKEAIEMCTEGADQHTGAWALTWYDEIEGSINFLRNKHRPLWYCFDEKFTRIYWASEWWMLEAVDRRDHIGLHKEGKEGYKFFPVTENIHYKFDVGLMKAGAEQQAGEQGEIKGREPPKVVSYTGGSVDPFGRVTSTSSQQTGFNIHDHRPLIRTQQSTTTCPGTTRPTLSSDNVIHWLGNVNHPYAGYITKEKFDKLAKYGCTWCQADVEYGDKGVTIFESDELVLCPTCSGHEEITDDTATRIYVPNKDFQLLRA